MNKYIKNNVEDYLNDGYEIHYTKGGQIFTRAGWYIQKSNKEGDVEDIFYLNRFILDE